MIYTKVLIVDVLDTQIPQYNGDPDEIHFVYAGDDRVKKYSSKSVLVPCFQQDNLDWDGVLMKLLNKCNQNTMRVRRPSWKMWDKAQEIIAEKRTTMLNIVTHPDIDFEPPCMTNVYTTPHCPKNLMFILPPPEWLGVVPIKTIVNTQGMAIMNSSLVIKVKLPEPEPEPHISLLDTLITL